MREAPLPFKEFRLSRRARNDTTNFFPTDPFFFSEAGQLPDGGYNPLPGTSRGAHGLD